MKITISVPGRFHAFDMAKQFQKENILRQIITSYPASVAKKYGLEPTLVSSIVSKEIILRGYKKIVGKYPNTIILNEWFDIIASLKINVDSDIYIIWSGFASHTIKKIRKQNPHAKIIIERGSTHIAFQNEILQYAYSFFPELRPTLPNPKVIEKEIAEYNLCDYVAIPSDFVKKTFIERNVSENKLLLVPYGVDLSSFTLRKKKSKQKLEILFTGNFSVQKGARTFIEILKKCQPDGNFHFNIVGGIEKGLMRYIQPFILNGLLSYTPHVPQSELNQHYQKADVFLFPSFQEGMAMVLLQAMACGLCIIASYNSGAGMLIQNEENGYLIEPEDVDEVISLLYLVQNKHYEIGLKARVSVENGYSWDNYGEKIIKNYKSILL